MATKPPRSDEERLHDDEFIAGLAIRSHRPTEIRRLLQEKTGRSVSVPTISKTLKRLKQAWARQSVDLAGAVLQVELRKLDLIESEAWTAWDKSKRDRVRKELKGSVGEGGGVNPAKSALTTEAQCGDASFLRIVLEVAARRASLLGLDYKDRMAEVDGGGPVVEAEATIIILPAEEMPKAREQYQIGLPSGNGGNGNGNGHTQ